MEVLQILQLKKLKPKENQKELLYPSHILLAQQLPSRCVEELCNGG